VSHVLSNVEIHNARIRYQVAHDQFDRELEKLFAASHYGLGQLVTMPSLTMTFWQEIMEKMEASGWGRLVR
jgi:hypothetical protein